MPGDTVELLVNGRRIDNFQSYSLDADIYTPADAFSLELMDPEAPVATGMRCEARVNGVLELTGLVDRTTRRADKNNGKRLVVEGRDLTGLLVDSYCEQFMTLKGKTVKQLAEMLLKKVPYINRKQLVYQQDVVGNLKEKKTVDSPVVGFLDTPQKLSQIEPGMTVFEVLRTYAMSRGLMFYAMPDGTFVFGRPKTGGAAAFRIILRNDGTGNNVQEGEVTEDISQRYSQVTVINQSQGFDADTMRAANINSWAVTPDPDFPFYKPFVATLNNDSQTPKLHGRLLLEKMRRDGFRLAYTAPGHSQGRRNWAINELVEVNDELNEVHGGYLIYGRTFTRSKAEGSCTKLRLGLPGMVA